VSKRDDGQHSWSDHAPVAPEQTTFGVAAKEYPDAEIESWWVANVLAWAQVSGPELLSHVTAGPGAAVGCAEKVRSRQGEAPERIARREVIAQGHRWCIPTT